jgi:hypothetical protein
MKMGALPWFVIDARFETPFPLWQVAEQFIEVYSGRNII